MHIAVASHHRLPVKGYGGTERIVVALVRGLAALGHRVTLIAATGTKLREASVVEVPPKRLRDPALDLSAYRILQEATTNVLKHARARRVDIRVHYSTTMLALDVRDDGAGVGTDPVASSGHGLIGMRERVAVFGGQLGAGRDPAGGFSVHARLPLTPSPLAGEGRGGG